MKHFINSPESSVQELVDGLILTYPKTLQKLANHDIILKRDIPANKVTLLSGGGSGHEPSHAGWIGEGMLDGAILGGMFASPSVKSILAGVRAVTPVGGPGCLLIVKNYTGDRLNFGMACELANAEGRKCKMVVVADDCAVPRNKGATGARGVCGTILVHKVAGAAALSGASLTEVAELANFVASRIGSLGVSIGGVCIPGQSQGRVEESEDCAMELGIGIHGEAGILKSPLLSAKEVSTKILNTIVDFGYGKDGELRLKAGDNVAVVLNNLGATSSFEMGILSKEVVSYLESTLKCNVTRIYTGAFMTSFDMHGISVSVCCLDEGNRVAPLLDAATTAPAWAKSEVTDESPRSAALAPLEEVTAPESADDVASNAATDGKLSADTIGQILRKVCNAILEAESKLTEWDLIVGDGDCGITMKRGASEILTQVDGGSLPLDNPVTLCLGLADAVSQSMGGTSGILFELCFRKMASVLKSSPLDFVSAFQSGVDAVMFYGGAKAGYRTMLDALVPAADALGTGGIAAAASAANEGADSTAKMKVAMAGRSNYLSEDQLEGTPDPGAKAVAIILSAIADVLA
eukprot:CAMPEP_0116032800 /NCGR_PEP_ID=MMETSP0321-20121206/18432_1 /TAXON_ID=163516 /ORGANISM="Leptocylindrus danicus var. danicus, Strain B650" /LENGTH=578 /DNA_ID=CAMNT_0003508399 /DNA_START=144 /DNA_END=1880 /DNA_ORIENTATION=+